MAKRHLVIRILGIITGLLAVTMAAWMATAIPDIGATSMNRATAGLNFSTIIKMAPIIIWPVLAIAAFSLPVRFYKLTLVLSWSAGLYIAVSFVPAFMTIGLFYLPVTIMFFIFGTVLFIDLPKPRPDIIWFLIIIIFSWSLKMAFMKFATPLAFSRSAILVIIFAAVIILIRRRPLPSWVAAVLVITLILPLISGLYLGQQAKNRHDFETIARQIVYRHRDYSSAQLTRLFVKEGQSTLKKGENFNGYIQRHKPGVWSASWQTVINGKTIGRSFFIADDPRQTNGIVVMTPPYNPAEADTGRDREDMKTDGKFDLVAKKIVKEHRQASTEELTRLFLEQGQSLMAGDDIFRAYIKKYKPGVWVVGWKIEQKDGLGDGEGFVIADDGADTNGVVVGTP